MANPPATKAEKKSADDKTDDAKKTPKVTKTLIEEDDEFEDFPADDWEATEEDKAKLHQWEDTWEDDEHAEDFAAQLK
ncbi:hypothetical protein HK102_000478 [Quaeritorhiza haematococci]|nr:hypothetical protein HK102_000478 [Quaeritorhiza haematococci]